MIKEPEVVNAVCGDGPPTRRNHERGVARIKSVLDKLRIGIFWIGQDRTVKLEAPWAI
jgi:hypothetical protein